MSLKLISAEQVHASLHYPEFVESLRQTFAAPHTMPPRQVLLLDPASGSHDAFAMLPSWNDEVIAQKAFTYFPDNQAPAQTLYSQIMLFDHIIFEIASDLPASCARADIVVSATGSTEVLVKGAWIRPGTHTDFIGNHHKDKRECDSELVTKSSVYVDSRENCFREAGEILIPVAEGVFSLDQVKGQLADLCCATQPARRSAEEITLFKSVGCALGDLCGALVAWRAENEISSNIKS
jgi:ornithine cyclodeaminase/alanine dehydrogenase-like protein (mu-crystallin family)